MPTALISGRAGMNYLRQGDFPNAEEQSKKLVDLDSSRGEGWFSKPLPPSTSPKPTSPSPPAFACRGVGTAGVRAHLKPLALYVWKKANQMLVRDVESAGCRALRNSTTRSKPRLLSFLPSPLKGFVPQYPGQRG